MGGELEQHLVFAGGVRGGELYEKPGVRDFCGGRIVGGSVRRSHMAQTNGCADSVGTGMGRDA